MQGSKIVDKLLLQDLDGPGMASQAQQGRLSISNGIQQEKVHSKAHGKILVCLHVV